MIPEDHNCAPCKAAVVSQRVGTSVEGIIESRFQSYVLMYDSTMFAQIGTGNVEVSSDVGSSSALDSGDSFSVTFTGIYGDVPLLTAVPASKATVTSSVEGDAPFRKETQAFYCTAGATGDLVLNWRGMGNVTVAGDVDLDSFESAVSSGLTNVTVVGDDASAVCSGELVYVTFQEVIRFVKFLFSPLRTAVENRTKHVTKEYFFSYIYIYMFRSSENTLTVSSRDTGNAVTLRAKMKYDAMAICSTAELRHFPRDSFGVSQNETRPVIFIPT